MIRCYVTDRRHGDIIAHSARAVASGVDIIQIREKDLDALRLLDLACRIRDVAAADSQSNTKIVVNGRLDIALISGLDGVHLPANGLPAVQVRPFVRTLGISCHSIEESIQAERDGVDYIIFGPVFETPGKNAVGVEALRQVAYAVKIPVLAIGGITPERASEVIAAGAAGVAAIRMFQQE